MNKNQTKIVLVALVLLLAGGGFLFLKRGKTQKPAEIQTPQKEIETEKKNEGSVFSSIKEALEKSISLKCQYRDKEGNLATVYFKKGMIRTDGVNKEGQKNSAIIKDDKLWFWIPESNQKGMFISLEVLRNQKPANIQIPNKDQIIKQAEEYKQNCQPTALSESLFEPPTNIEFDNLDEIMKSIGK